MVCPNKVSVRWLTAVLGCFGFIIIYGHRVNLSVAVIAMVNHTAVAEEESYYIESSTEDYSSENISTSLKCDGDLIKEKPEDGPFTWNENVQGLILGSYFYGYIFTQILGGWLAERFSAKHVYGTGIFLNSLGTLLSPVAAKMSYVALMVIRILMGASAGITLPAMHVIIANWSPPQERSKMSSTIYAGCTLGTVIFLPFSGILASEWGWESIFYVEGVLGLVFYAFWLIFIYDSPAIHPMISREEKSYILTYTGETETSVAEKKNKPSMPWLSVWKSGPVWAIIIAHTCNNWGWYMLLVKLPSYMKHILKFDMKSNGALSALPYLTMWVLAIILANILDYLRAKGTISTTFARKFATFIASVPPGICLVTVTYVGCNSTLALVLLTIGMTCLGGIFSGFLGNHIDIAPPFAGTLMGISNTFGTVPGILVASVVGYITNNNQTVEAWRTVFYITLGIFLVESTAFLLLGSGERQEWAKTKKSKSEEEEAVNLER